MLQQTDLFFVNRGQQTYTLLAEELGTFLLTMPKPPGFNEDDKYVNDGITQIDDFNGQSIVLNTNNNYKTGTLTFEEGFVLRGMDFSPKVSVDKDWLINEIYCPDSGFNVCDCISLDMDWITENLICEGTPHGLVDLNGCIGINICSNHDNALTLDNGCLGLELCGGTPGSGGNGGIIAPNGCLEIDRNWIAAEMPCVDSGIIKDPNSMCLSLDYDKILSSINLGKIRSNTINVSNNGDLTKGDVYIEYSGGGGGGLNESDVINIINKKVDCVYIDALGCDFSTPPPPGPSDKDIVDLIKDTVDCDYIDNLDCVSEPPEDKCDILGNIWGQKLVLRKSGTGQEPAITWGTGRGSSGLNDIYMGMGGSTSNRRVRFTSDDGWDETKGCGGEPTKGKLELFTFQMGPPENKTDLDANWSNRTFKPRTMKSLSGGVIVKAKNAGQWDDKLGNLVDGKEIFGHSIQLFYETPFRNDNTDEVTSYNDTTLASFDLNSILDNLADGATSTMDGGSSLIRWGKLNAEEMERKGDDYINHVSPFIDLDQLQAIHPYLVKTEYTTDSYEPVYDEDGNIIGEQIKSNPADRTTIPIEINDNILTLMLIARARRQKARIETLESQVSELMANKITSSVENASDDSDAAYKGVPVGGLYRNGSQLMVRVS